MIISVWEMIILLLLALVSGALSHIVEYAQVRLEANQRGAQFTTEPFTYDTTGGIMRFGFQSADLRPSGSVSSRQF